MNRQNSDEIRNRIMNLLSESGKSDKDLESYLEIGRGRVAHWRYDRNVTFLQFIIPICEYFHTNPNYLFFGVEQVEDPVELSPDEKDLVRLYRQLDDRKQKYVKEGLKIFTET